MLHVGGLLRQGNHRRGYVLVSALTRRASSILYGEPAGRTPNNLRYGRRQRVDLPFVRRFQQAEFSDRAKFPSESSIKENSNNKNK